MANNGRCGKKNKFSEKFIVKKIPIAVCFLFLRSVLYAGLADFGAGYELIKGKFYSPRYTADWSWSGDWQIRGSFQKSQSESDLNFSFLFLKFAKTKVLNNVLSAAFETGFYFPVSSSKSEFSIPFFSTSTSPSTNYNWEVSPSTYSVVYNFFERKLFVLPLLARLDFDSMRLLKISLAAGFYLTHLEETQTEGEEFELDHTEYSGSIKKEFRAGDIQEYKTWRQQTNLIPVLKLSVSSWIKLRSNVNLDFSAGFGWLKPTKFLYEEYTEAVKLKSGYEIGGCLYNIAFGINILF
ncbi:MAG: hypothetical protein J7L54_05930 [Elusimicrobia bacterium]|nr:hypothetical protein [Elusimicrobiota bacterium]